MFKRLARFILRREIKDYEDRITNLNKHLNEGQKDLSTTLVELNTQADQALTFQKKIDDLTKENDILKKYYHLGEEPTEEQQAKIRINLKIHELEMRLLQMASLTSGIATMNYSYNAMNLNAMNLNAMNAYSHRM